MSNELQKVFDYEGHKVRSYKCKSQYHLPGLAFNLAINVITLINLPFLRIIIYPSPI